ncbi:MAG: copper chaperone PCu(A)C [Actinomycetes bacterium]
MRRLLLAAAVALAAACAALAHDYSACDLRIAHPWTLPTAAGAPAAAGYMDIANTGRSGDRLVSASTPHAARVEIHQSSMEGGMMRMKALPEGVEIPAGGKVSLAPGGLHLMLFGPKAAVTEGDRIPVTLTFARAGKVTVQLAAESRPAARPMAEGHRH